jgi:hypothetical protein
MKRTSSLILIGAVAALFGAAQGCHFQAGVKGDEGAAGTGAAGKIAGAAGMSGAAGIVGTAGTTGAAGAIGPPLKPCAGLECQQSTCLLGDCKVPACKPGEHTTVSGKIYDPAGKTPLYNITVYVPNAPLDPINDGPSCDPCDPVTGTSLLSGKPVVIAKTDEKGDFHLGKTSAIEVPAGTNIPMVIQVGKWRREVVLPSVTACQDNVITDMNLLHLPRNSQEGHIPKMAITTGEADALQCLLLKIGVDKSEFTPEVGPGRINLFTGGGGSSAYDTSLNGGAMFTAAAPWWDSYDNLAKYDILLHSCDGSQGDYDMSINPMTGMPRKAVPTFPKSMEARTALQQFADKGGRVFASHWHAYWFDQGTAPFKSIATWGRNNRLAQAGTIDTSFPTGMSLAQWLVNVGGSMTLGQVDIVQNASNRLIDMAAGGNISRRWIYSATQTPQSVMFLSATTPIPGGTCGRAVVSDLHVTSGMNQGMTMMGDQPTAPFPTSCVTTDLAPREKVLEFMLFDIASCVQAIIP